MKHKLLRVITYCILTTIFLSQYVYANSSWIWLTTSPKKILPIAIVVTLLIEVVGILKVCKISNVKRISCSVLLANIISFIVPYIHRAYRFIPTSGGFSLSSAFDKGPYYMILSGYLFLTLIIEIPVVYGFLRKEVNNKKKLIITILIVNIITTILVAVLERIICIGQW